MLFAYHEKYAARSDDDIASRAKVKEIGLAKVVHAVEFHAESSPARIAILGCAERRFVGHHRDIFERLLNTPVEVTTFDITVEHLAGEPGVIRHDIALPLPGGPYDIAYGDVVLKFLPEEHRLSALRHSYEALREPGLAIHILDDGDALPVMVWKSELEASGVRCEVIPLEIVGVLPMPIHETALVLMK